MKWGSVFGIIGGSLWVGWGTILALRPGSVPGVSFRASTDVMPWLGAGLLLIAAMLYSLNYRQGKQGGKLTKWASFGAVLGASLYAFGHLIRQFLSGAWEPAVPLGFLIFILSLLLIAIAAIRARTHSKHLGMALLCAAIFLLFFNDQFITAWSAVPFGLACIISGILTIIENPARNGY